MKISIDPERCQGHGRCWDTAPDLVDADDDGRGVIRGPGEVPPELVDQAETAERVCPERAVILSR